MTEPQPDVEWAFAPDQFDGLAGNVVFADPNADPDRRETQ